jgi:hypothetical protein
MGCGASTSTEVAARMARRPHSSNHLLLEDVPLDTRIALAMNSSLELPTWSQHELRARYALVATIGKVPQRIAARSLSLSPPFTLTTPPGV